MWLVLALTLLAHSAPWLELTYSGITPQLYEWDCAPACADTLLSWSQIPVQDGIWEEVTEPGKPISFRHLQHYFAAYSLEAAGYRLDWDAFSSFLEENRGTPLLVHFTEGKGHFALVWDFAPEGVLTGDPAHGVQFIPERHFRYLWSGAVLHFPDLHRLSDALAVSDAARGRAQLLQAVGMIRP